MLILLGAPGVGKGTQAQKLVAHLGVPQISTGDILRAEIRKNTPLGQKALTYMNKGELVPDNLILDMVSQRLEAPDAKNGVIFDGFPRTIAQAKGLDGILEQSGRKLDTVLSIEVPAERIVERLSSRRSCATCGAVFNVLLNPDEIDNHECPEGQPLIVQREDDRPETVERRLKVYAEQTEPLKDYYRQTGLLKEVPGEGTIDDVFARLLQAL
ncbi:adenylate kinase [bacterium]|nr:adenylate kinase [bacterium]